MHQYLIAPALLVPPVWYLHGPTIGLLCLLLFLPISLLAAALFPH